jgi:tRNA pseudouridine55 synthase
VLLRGAGIPAAADPVHATYAGKSVAIGAIERGEFHPRRVFKAG